MIELVTRYTYDRYKQFCIFSFWPGKYHRFKMIFHFVLMIPAPILAIYYAQLGRTTDALLFALLFAFTIHISMRPLIAAKKYAKQAPALLQTDQVFVFSEDSFTGTQTGDLVNGSTTSSYSSLIKACETKDTIYAYISPSSAYILPKSDITKGTVDELRALLQSKLPEGKYIICK